MLRRSLFCLAGALTLAGAASVGSVACSTLEDETFPLENLSAGGSGGAGGTGGSDTLVLDSGTNHPPALDAGGLCGNQIHAITSKPPIIYFIFDISGSMVTPEPGGTRYSLLQEAAYSLVKNLRYVIRVGAAAFPLNATTAQCNPGGEIYPVHFDDPFGFDNATASIEPNGGTPTAATLTALTPKLAALGDNTIAILTTDGGANCNPNATCTTAQCEENIEGCAPEDSCCAENQNCCSATGPAGPLNCLDADATVAAVTGMANAGVKVAVIGIPGSQPYASVLTQMAFAGGAPSASAPFYYDVQDLSTLSSVLQDIAGAAVSCSVTIDEPPSMPGYTNVYLDQQLIPYGTADGWTWSAANVVTLQGTSCAELRSGEVAEVQVVSGCPTQTQ
jgi:hypothetical protein